MYFRTKIKLYNVIATAMFKVAEVAEEVGRRLRVCPECGHSRFYGPPCKGLDN